jgi:hypothetical protein
MINKLNITERIVKMETKIENVSKKMDEHCSEQRQDFDRVFNKLDTLNNKFAGKWVEKIVVGLLVSIVLSIITLMINQLLK